MRKTLDLVHLSLSLQYSYERYECDFYLLCFTFIIYKIKTILSLLVALFDEVINYCIMHCNSWSKGFMCVQRAIIPEEL